MAAIAYSPGPADGSELHTLFETYGWWADRDENDIRRALVETDEAMVLGDEDSDELVAVARVLTDDTYYATVFDVIVGADRRGGVPAGNCWPLSPPIQRRPGSHPLF